jgi:Sugar kinases, ribokinase family
MGGPRVGWKSALITKVGKEHMGRVIMEQLCSEGVDVSNIKTEKERITALGI